MSEDKSYREHKHIQNTKATFHSETLAPIKVDGKAGKPRFSVEPLVYIQGVGWEIVDITEKGNEFAIAFYNYVKLKEFMGYQHTGNTSEQIKTMLENLWGEKVD